MSLLGLTGRALRSPWDLLNWLSRMSARVLRSARFWIVFLLLLIATLVVYYATSDKWTPFTRDVYVQAYVVQVAPRVAGEVVQVLVQENQPVTRGDLLFVIDPRPYEHRVTTLEAKRSLAIQQVAQMESDLQAEKAEEARLSAEESYARTVFDQESQIFKKEATTERKYVEARQKYQAARSARERSKALARQKEQALEARLGSDHALIAEVEAQLATAQLDLEWTKVRAAATGYVSNVQLRVGSHVRDGQPVLTLIDGTQFWIVANFRETNLEFMHPGQPAEISLKKYPGRIFRGQVQSLGWGVGEGQGVPSGELPRLNNAPIWLHPAQRFPVRVVLDPSEDVLLQVGMKGSVTVFVEEEPILGPLARFWQLVDAWLHYLG